MIRDLLSFYAQRLYEMIALSWRKPEFLYQEHLTSHAHYRRLSPRYLAKKRLVKAGWTIAVALLLLFPVPPLIGGTLLFGTCLSFAILDETK